MSTAIASSSAKASHYPTLDRADSSNALDNLRPVDEHAAVWADCRTRLVNAVLKARDIHRMAAAAASPTGTNNSLPGTPAHRPARISPAPGSGAAVVAAPSTKPPMSPLNHSTTSGGTDSTKSPASNPVTARLDSIAAPPLGIASSATSFVGEGHSGAATALSAGPVWHQLNKQMEDLVSMLETVVARLPMPNTLAAEEVDSGDEAVVEIVPLASTPKVASSTSPPTPNAASGGVSRVTSNGMTRTVSGGTPGASTTLRPSRRTSVQIVVSTASGFEAPSAKPQRTPDAKVIDVITTSGDANGGGGGGGGGGGAAANSLVDGDDDDAFGRIGIDGEVAKWLNSNYAEDHHRVSTGFEVRLQRSHSMVSAAPAEAPVPSFNSLVEEALRDDHVAPLLIDTTTGKPAVPTQYERTHHRTYRTCCSERKIAEHLEKAGSLPRIADINSPDFNIFPWAERCRDDVLTVVAANVFLQYNFVASLQLDVKRLVAFFRALQNHYRSINPYHNAVHAADVLQTTNVYLCCGDVKENFSDVELLAILFAAVIHDVGHLGIANAFLMKTRHPLAVMYNDQSCLENAHLALAFIILERPENNFFVNSRVWTAAFHTDFRQLVIESVMGTDMKHHAALTQNVICILEDGKIEDDEVPRLFKAIVHAADLSNPMKPLPVYLEWCCRVMAEFWQQGDEERRRNLPISPMCDRNVPVVAKTQIGFMEFVVRPFMKELAPVLPPVWLTRFSRNLEFMRNLTPDKEKAILDRVRVLSEPQWHDLPIGRRSFLVAMSTYVDEFVVSSLSIGESSSSGVGLSSPANRNAAAAAVSMQRGTSGSKASIWQAHQARLVDVCDQWVQNISSLRLGTGPTVAPIAMDVSPVLLSPKADSSNRVVGGGSRSGSDMSSRPQADDDLFFETLSVAWLTCVLELQQQQRRAMLHDEMSSSEGAATSVRANSVAALRYLEEAVLDPVNADVAAMALDSVPRVTTPLAGAPRPKLLDSPKQSEPRDETETAAPGNVSPWTLAFGTADRPEPPPGLLSLDDTGGPTKKPSLLAGGVRTLQTTDEPEVIELITSKPRLAVEMFYAVIGAKAPVAKHSTAAIIQQVKAGGIGLQPRQPRVLVMEPVSPSAGSSGPAKAMLRFVAALTRIIMSAFRQHVSTTLEAEKRRRSSVSAVGHSNPHFSTAWSASALLSGPTDFAASGCGPSMQLHIPLAAAATTGSSFPSGGQRPSSQGTLLTALDSHVTRTSSNSSDERSSVACMNEVVQTPPQQQWGPAVVAVAAHDRPGSRGTRLEPLTAAAQGSRSLSSAPALSLSANSPPLMSRTGVYPASDMALTVQSVARWYAHRTRVLTTPSEAPLASRGVSQAASPADQGFPSPPQPAGGRSGGRGGEEVQHHQHDGGNLGALLQPTASQESQTSSNEDWSRRMVMATRRLRTPNLNGPSPVVGGSAFGSHHHLALASTPSPTRTQQSGFHPHRQSTPAHAAVVRLSGSIVPATSSIGGDAEGEVLPLVLNARLAAARI